MIPSHARPRLFTVPVLDGGPDPLSVKLLRRPRLMERIRDLIPDKTRAHLVPYNTTELERDLAVRLGIPMYGADPRHFPLGTKSGCRQLFEEEGIPYPLGVENLSSIDEVIDAGVLVVSGGTKIAFDPIFRNDFGTYRLLPEGLEKALFEGKAPFDGLDAVFISHYHEDHFSAVDVPRLLRERPEVRLYAPAQAVSEMKDIDDIRSRITAIALEYKDPPLAIEAEDLLVEAVRVPHSGWPDRRLDVENLAYRVTLDGSATVLHLGDADTSEVHFTHDPAYWDRRRTHMAFPPYWYFQSDDGRRVLDAAVMDTDHGMTQ